MNLYIVCEINLWPLNLDRKLTLFNFLFGLIRLTENADPDKYFYSGYGIGFDTRATFSLSDRNGFNKNITIFVVDNSSSVHAKKDT